MKEKYITVSEAVALMNGEVTGQTIRNLCTAGVMKYRVVGHMYRVSDLDVKAMYKKILHVHQATNSIESLEWKLMEKEAELKQRLADVRTELTSIGYYPRAIQLLADLSKAIFKLYEDALMPQEYAVIAKSLETGSIGDAAEQCCMTKECARQRWVKGLRRLSSIANRDKQMQYTIDALTEQNLEIQSKLTQAEDKLFSYEQTIPESVEEREYVQNYKKLSIWIPDCDLSVRCINCLRAADIYTVYDLVAHKRSDMLKFRQFGKKSLNELDEFLESLGLNWGMNLRRYPKPVKV